MGIPIIDSHIHLWPVSAANPDGHAWMVAVPQLAKQHILSDYRKAARQDLPAGYSVEGVVYVETDRQYTSDTSRPIEQWAKGPLDEIRFLRSIVEGDARETHADLLKGIIPWAPLDQGPEVFEQWIDLAKRTAGEQTWSRIKGFRFLLQAITERAKFEQLVLSQAFTDTLKAFSKEDRNFVFDVGIDAHSGGLWQLEAWVKVLEQVNGRGQGVVKFVMNHMCKPDMTESHTPGARGSPQFMSWAESIRAFASYPRVYMKLSGAFSELSNGVVDTVSAEEIAKRIKPWTDVVFEAFGPERIMFGSDWPVSNVRGPAGEDSWTIWKDVVDVIVQQRDLSDDAQHRIWTGTAREAYALQL
ncbi:hypothetical protein CAC42_7021 [Sphaceloma murrayae]|uniref:Amidohydrolase-related domain-containing protein n=1 Tax=Sphaceloma murrayae TaxID=2082308 RepID=A0A2K1QQH1_9PEZI|nr:hypothetical protein CAC42_7021 [Sphaceloma murrayae]